MPALRDLQAGFAAALNGGEEAALADAIKPKPGLSAGAQIAIYRNNVRGALTRALKSLYPALAALVGEDFFDALAGAYIRHEPPGHGRMGEWGHDVPAFLDAFPPAAGYPYFADVARLELASFQCYAAPEAEPLAPAALNGLEPEAAAALRLELHPAVRLLASAHPVLTIYEIARASDGAETPAVPEAGERVLIQRHGEDVEMERLSPGNFAFLASLAEGVALADAAAAADASQADFDLPVALSSAFRRGIFAAAKDNSEHQNQGD